tara:strand:- start:303 stop:704 length:402 start_codon:yes stop_codon:yes gene_type:complete
MAIQTVNIGTSPNDGTGDSLRSGADKYNDNFTDATNAASKLVKTSVDDATVDRAVTSSDFQPATLDGLGVTHLFFTKAGTISSGGVAAGSSLNKIRETTAGNIVVVVAPVGTWLHVGSFDASVTEAAPFTRTA